jgi:integrase
MASLHIDPRSKSKIFIGAFTDATGKQVKRSTGQTDRLVAKAVVEGWEKAAKLASKLELTEHTARTILNEILERAGQSKIYNPSISTFLADWLQHEKDSEADKSDSDLHKKDMAVRLFIESLGKRSTVPLASVTESDIAKFRKDLLVCGRRPATVAHLVRNILGQAFRFAVRKGYITVNPIGDPPKNKRDSDKLEKGTFSPEQVARMAAAASCEWRGMILFGYFTGQRLSDLANLTWNNIGDDGVLRLKQRKTGTSVVIPLRPELSDYLLTLPTAESNSAPLFPSLYGKETGGSNGLSRSFTEVMKASGIISGAILERGNGVSRTVNALTFHALRHSFNSVLLNSGVSQELRMRMTGHSSTAMNDRYSHAEIETLRGALNQLPKLSENVE